MAIDLVIPNFSVSMVNPATGGIDPIWYQFLLQMFNRTNQSGGAVNSVLGTAPIVSSGGVAPAISITPATAGFPGSMSAADKSKLDAITTIVSSVLGSAPIVSSGGINPTISITTATGSANGSMSAADKAKLDTIPGSISCFLAYKATTGQALSAGVQTVGVFDTKVFDDNVEYSVATSKFTAKVAGTYVFNAGYGGTQVVPTRRQLSLYVNGAVRAVMQDSTADSGVSVLAGSSGPVRLAAGDTVNAEFFSTLADTTAVGQAITYFSGWRIK